MTNEKILLANGILDYFGKHSLPPPVIVGGVGGSGTRLIVKLLREMSIQMGENVNVSEDAKEFIGIYDAHITTYLLKQFIDMPVFQADLLSAIKAHRQNMVSGNWGWKNPRTIYLLPILDKLMPSFNYIHVIRDGLEMVGSSNKNQLEKYQSCLLSSEQVMLPSDIRAILFWATVNQSASNYGIAHMGERYMLLRFEDVCSDPTEAMRPIAERLGLVLPKKWNETIRLPEKRKEKIRIDNLGQILAVSGDALKRFGYPY